LRDWRTSIVVASFSLFISRLLCLLLLFSLSLCFTHAHSYAHSFFLFLSLSLSLSLTLSPSLSLSLVVFRSNQIFMLKTLTPLRGSGRYFKNALTSCVRSRFLSLSFSLSLSVWFFLTLAPALAFFSCSHVLSAGLFVCLSVCLSLSVCAAVYLLLSALHRRDIQLDRGAGRGGVERAVATHPNNHQ